MALKLDILANTRQLISEMRKGGASVEDVSDALDDLAKEGDKAGDQLERTFRDMARDSKKAGDDIKKNVSGGLREASDEAQQSGREAAASFSGEWTDVGDFLQETVANGLSGFGPLGIAAGIAGAAGIGIITQTILSQQEAADELKARLSDAYKTAAEEGRTYLDTAQLIAEASDLMFNKDRAEEWKQVQEDAKMLGLDIYDVIAANAGELGAQRDLQERINALIEETDGKASSYAGKLLVARERWEDINAESETAQENARKLADVVAESEERNREQIDRTARVAGERYEGLAEKYGQGLTISVKVDDSQAQAALTRLQNRAAEGIDVIVRPGQVIWD